MSPRGSRTAPHDQRYWRRRANRRVRKARRARTLLRWSLIVSINFVIVGVLAVSGYRGLRQLHNNERFTLQHVRIEGIERSSGDRLRERLADLIGENLLDLDLDRVARFADDDPWVSGASVKRLLPDTLQVHVHERVPAALAVIDGLAHLVDRRGEVIGTTGPGMADDLPVLTGLEGVEGSRLRNRLARGVDALARLREVDESWAAELSEVDLSRADRVRVRLRGSDPVLLLDPERIDRNVTKYLSLRAEIESQVGPAQHVDLRWRNRISVLPVVRVSPLENG